MSAVNDIGIEELAKQIQSVVYSENEDCSFLIPYTVGKVASYFMEHATILDTDYREDGVFLRVNCHKQDAAKYEVYRCE